MARKTWLKPSTTAFTREARRTPGYSLFDWVHGYVYARWHYLYIGIGTGEHPLARLLGPPVRWLTRLFPPRTTDDSPVEQGVTEAHPKPSRQNPDRVTFADTYHGKVVPLEAATQLVTVEEDIRLTDLEQVIPYARARDIVLQNPDHIVVLECPCRASRPNPCQPLDVCLIVGEPFASFIAEHHPDRSRWLTSEEAVEVLHAEDERGHVHHAFFKDATGPFLRHLQLLRLLLRGDAGPPARHPDAGLLRLRQPRGHRSMRGLWHVCRLLPIRRALDGGRHRRRGRRRLYGLRGVRLPMHTRSALARTRSGQGHTARDPRPAHLTRPPQFSL